MTAAPDLFDIASLARHRARASLAPARFLHQEALSLIAERLIEVNRAFPETVIVGAEGDFWAQTLTGHPKLSRIATCPDTPTLAIDPASTDLVLSALCLHWANDPVGHLIQARLALRPDGLMIAVLFGGQTLIELRRALAEAEVAVTGGLSPRVAPMGEIRDLGGLLQRAGFVMPVADADRLTVTYADAFALMRDLRAMGETNALTGRLRHPTQRAVLLEAARLYTARHGGPDGRIPATFEMVFLTGWAPGPDQPQPLRPGSATTRLADALGTRETRLPGPDTDFGPD